VRLVFNLDLYVGYGYDAHLILIGIGHSDLADQRKQNEANKLNFQIPSANRLLSGTFNNVILMMYYLMIPSIYCFLLVELLITEC